MTVAGADFRAPDVAHIQEETAERLQAQDGPLRGAHLRGLRPDPPPAPFREEAVQAGGAGSGGSARRPPGTSSPVALWSHVGTHFEAARHFYRTGKDTSEFPLEHGIGPAVRVDLRHKRTNEPITVDDFRRATAGAGGIREGDRVLIGTGKGPLPHPALPRPPQRLGRGGGVADRRPPDHGPGHQLLRLRGAPQAGATRHPLHTLFSRPGQEVPMIECMRGLGALPRDRFFYIGLPLPVKNMDASPIRAVALVPTDAALARLLGL